MNTGTLTADGTEQTVLTTSASTARLLHGYILFKNMQSGDTVEVRSKIYIDGAYESFDLDTLSDAQDPNTAPFKGLACDSGANVRITLKQTAGTYRDYPYQWVLE